MRILLFNGGKVINAASGAERVLCNMANELTHRGHQVTVMCNNIQSGLPFYSLDPRVNFINLDGSGKKRQYPQYKKIIRALTKPLRKTPLFPLFPDPIFSQKLRKLSVKVQTVIHAAKPDIIVSYFLGDLHFIANAIGHEHPLILMHHFNPDKHFLHQPHNVLQSLRHCDCLQVLMPSFERRIQAVFPWIKTVCIPNIVESVTEEKSYCPDQNKNEYLITMLGRFDSKQKQQHFLIRSFARLAKDYPQWKVHFYGGSHTPKYEEYLRGMIQKFSLGNQVFLMGTTDQPLNVLQKSDIFAFPSAFEGFGLALAEAMSVGLPCVGLKTAPAVNELIIDGYNGFLSENNEADFAQKLKRLIDDPSLRAELGQNGREFVKQFEPKKIWDQWESLIFETVQQFRQRKPNPKKAA